MKLISVCSLMISVGAIGLIGGPSPSWAGSQTDSDMYGMPVRMPATHAGPAFNTGGQGNQSGGSSVANASSSGNGSSNGSVSSSENTSSSQNSFSNRLQNRDSNGSSTGITREKVIDTGEKGKETQTRGKTEAALETDKTFKPILLETAVSDISHISHRTDTDRNASSEDARFKAKHETAKDKDDSRKKD